MTFPPPYRLQTDLGRSPLGDLYEVEDTRRAETVRLHVLDRRLRITPDVLNAFMRDSAILRELQSPDIIPFLDCFMHDGRLHLVTPRVEGLPLPEHLARHGPPDNATLQHWAVTLVSAISQAHDEGVLHGDLRSGSVYIVPMQQPVRAALPSDQTQPSRKVVLEEVEPGKAVLSPGPPGQAGPAWRLVVGDFGLYRLIEGARLTTTSARLDLPNFTSPQRWQGERPGIDDDVWGVGVLLFLLMSGRLPFDGPTDAATMNRVLNDPTPNLRGLRPKGPVAIMERCLEKDTRRRYRSLRGVLADLERGQPKQGTRRRKGLLPRPTNPRLSWAIFLAVILLMLGIPAGGAVSIVARNQPTPTPIPIAGVIISPTPSPTQTPVIVAFAASPIGPPSATPTATATYTPIVITNTPTVTFTPSDTPTNTATASITPSRTPTATASPSETATPTATLTGTPPPTVTASFTPSETPTLRPSDSPTPTATFTSTATFTATATPTATANATATANYEAFLTRDANLRGTEVALATRRAPTATPDAAQTAVALETLAVTLQAYRPARTAFSAVPLCAVDESLLSYADFDGQTTLSTAPPGGFVPELIGGHSALHLARTADWILPLPPGQPRLRLDLLVAAAGRQPLTVRLARGDSSAAWDGWQLGWSEDTVGGSPGLLLTQVNGGVPGARSPMIAVPLNQWFTLELALREVLNEQRIVALTIFTPDGPLVSSLPVTNNQAGPLFESLVVSASIDSAPWLDNLLLCLRPPAGVEN